MSQVPMLGVSEIRQKIRRLSQVRWMSFYNRHVALQYDRDVRTYVARRQVKRVWFYASRWNIR